MNKKIMLEDYYLLKKASDIRVTKNYVAWVEKTSNRKEKGYHSHIFLLNKKISDIRQFTAGKGDFHPRFSPDEMKLAFISSRNEKPQIFIMNLDGGESIALTSAEEGVSSFEWSPDGSKIAFISKIDNDWEQNPAETDLGKEIYELKKKDRLEKSIDPRILNKIVYRTGTSYLSDIKYDQIFVIDVESKKSHQVSEGKFNYSPISWIDSDHVLSIAKRELPIDLSETAELIKFDINKMTTGEVVVNFSKTYFPSPPVSEHGKIFVQYDLERKKAGQNNHWGQVEGNELKVINKELDRSIGNLKVYKDYMLCIVEDQGRADLRKYVNGEFSTIIRPNCSIESFGGDIDEIYFIGTDPRYPSAIWKSNGHESKLIHDPNSDWLDEKDVVIPEEFWLENPEGVKFQGWFFDAGKKDGSNPPMILSVHGGPHVMWNNAGSMWHEWQVSLSRGYSILALNPIGSGGYGEAFSQIITGKWGFDDARDLMQAVDHFVDRVDENQLYTTGGSYAGFQVANIIGRYHRFKAACAQRGVYNLSTFWTNTDIPLFGIYEATTTPWENLDLMWDISPISRVPNIKTPLLLIHSENDFRVAISQAEELYGSMKYHGQEVEFIRYPRDGHELSRSGEPDHVIDRLQRMLDFFDKH